MPSCAACQTPFTKEFRGLKCTLCDDRRVAEPAYYCDRACQKTHWREHKAFHAQLEIQDQKFHERLRAKKTPSSDECRARAADDAASSDQFVSLCGQANQARMRGDHREAVKRAKKAIALAPAEPDGYFLLALAYARSADFTNAAPNFLKAMDLYDTYLQDGIGIEFKWANAASLAFSCFVQCDDAPKPAWFTDTQQLKRMADRAIAAMPDNHLALQMRIKACRRTPMNVSTMDDLRQALRDVRGCLASLEEGSEQYSRFAVALEAEIRKRIAEDLAALKLADD
jgi:tetratricopeptide (TPR) repeat protein